MSDENNKPPQRRLFLPDGRERPPTRWETFKGWCTEFWDKLPYLAKVLPPFGAAFGIVLWALIYFLGEKPTPVAASPPAPTQATNQVATNSPPENPMQRYALGVQLAMGNKIKEAREQFEEVVRLSPEFSRGHYSLSLALAEEGRFGEAIREMEESLRLEPTHASAKANLELLKKGMAPTKIPNRLQAGSPDFIPGTRVTHGQLGRTFPFGYIVFSERDGNWKHDARPSNKLTYFMEPNDVEFKPDFSSKKVEVILKRVNAKGGAGLTIEDGPWSQKFPMKDGPTYRFGLYSVPNEPELLFATLSDDQRFPIFVIGFAIVPQNE